MKTSPLWRGFFLRLRACEERQRRSNDDADHSAFAKIVGWAKAPSAVPTILVFDAYSMRGMVGTLRFAHPTISRNDDAAGSGLLLRLREAVVERVAGAAHGADRILLAARIEQLAQPSDKHVDGAH